MYRQWQTILQHSEQQTSSKTKRVKMDIGRGPCHFPKKCDRTSNTTTQGQAAPTALPQPHAQAQSTATTTEHNHKHRPQPQPLEQPQLARAICTTNLWNSNSDNPTNRAYTFEPKPVAKVQCSMILWQQIPTGTTNCKSRRHNHKQNRKHKAQPQTQSTSTTRGGSSNWSNKLLDTKSGQSTQQSIHI